MSIDVGALLNLYQVASLDSRLAINNKDALDENVANGQATKSFAIFTNDKFNASDDSLKRRVHQTKNVTSKNKNVIFESLLASAIEET